METIREDVRLALVTEVSARTGWTYLYKSTPFSGPVHLPPLDAPDFG
jgi:hypothetical protein